MIVTIHQPEYLPWLGFFDRLDQADVFIILDDIIYQKWGFHNRNKIKTSQDWQWLTVPIKARESRKKICEMEIDKTKDWGKVQEKALVYNYSKALYFKKYLPFFRGVFEREWAKIAELDIYLLKNIMQMLGIETEVKIASKMDIPGRASERLVKLCQAVAADTYLSGPGAKHGHVSTEKMAEIEKEGVSGAAQGKGYLDLALFKKEGIKVVFQEFTHPQYPQQFPEQGFLPYMSIIDLLFNCGDKSLEIIRSGRKA